MMDRALTTARVAEAYARLKYNLAPGELDMVGLRQGAWDAWDDALLLWDGQDIVGEIQVGTTQPGRAKGSIILPGRYKHSHQTHRKWRQGRTGWPQGQTILAQWGKTPLRYADKPRTPGHRGTHVHGVIPPIPAKPGSWSEGCVVARLDPAALEAWLAPVLAQPFTTLTILDFVGANP